MPRRSTASLSVVAVTGRPERLEPRAGAPAIVKTLFRELVASVPVEHFKPADAHLLEQYCQAIALARLAFKRLEECGPVTEDGKASPWNIVLEKAHRSSVALSARLRLAPQSRTDPKSAGRERSPVTSPPWEIK